MNFEMEYLPAIAGYWPRRRRRTLPRKSEVRPDPTHPNRHNTRTQHIILTQKPKLAPRPLPYGENETQWLNSVLFFEFESGEIHFV